MADITEREIITAASSFDLLTLDELKTSLGLTTTTEDAKLILEISRYSDVVARMCNRVFGYEEVIEVWDEVDPLKEARRPRARIFLEHFPVRQDEIVSIEAPEGNVLDPSTYKLEPKSGKVEFVNGGCQPPIVVHYWGGYDLPDQAPQALKQACELVIRDARMLANIQQSAGIRSLMHKDSRVMFFDTTQALIAASKNAGQAFSSPHVQALLYKFTRFYV